MSLAIDSPDASGTARRSARTARRAGRLARRAPRRRRAPPPPGLSISAPASRRRPTPSSRSGRSRRSGRRRSSCSSSMRASSSSTRRSGGTCPSSGRRRRGVGVGHGPPPAHAHERDRRRPLRRHRPRGRRARAYVASCAELRQVHPLGATMSYCNTGFSVLGRVVETSPDSVWDAAIRTRLSSRSGSRTRPRFPRTCSASAPRSGTSSRPARSCRSRRCGGCRAPPGLPAGSARPRRDLLEFAALHLGAGKAPAGDRLLRDDSLAAMQEPHAVVPSGHRRCPPALGPRLVDLRVERQHGARARRRHDRSVRVPARRP